MLCLATNSHKNWFLIQTGPCSAYSIRICRYRTENWIVGSCKLHKICGYEIAPDVSTSLKGKKMDAVALLWDNEWSCNWIFCIPLQENFEALSHNSYAFFITIFFPSNFQSLQKTWSVQILITVIYIVKIVGNMHWYQKANVARSFLDIIRNTQYTWLVLIKGIKGNFTCNSYSQL